MASTGINNGTLVTLYLNGTAIAHCTSNSIEIAQALRDASNKGSQGWKDNLPGQRSWKTSLEGLFAENATFGFFDLMSSITNRASFTAKYSSEVSGDKYLTGTAYLSNLKRDSPNEDNETFTCDLEGSGPLTVATV